MKNIKRAKMPNKRRNEKKKTPFTVRKGTPNFLIQKV